MNGAFYHRDRDWHPPALTPGYKTSVTRAPTRPLIALDGTLSEITGPVFGHDLIGPLDNDLILNFAKPGESAIGERIVVHGRVTDQDGRGVPGVLHAPGDSPSGKICKAPATSPPRRSSNAKSFARETPSACAAATRWLSSGSSPAKNGLHSRRAYGAARFGSDADSAGASSLSIQLCA